MFFYWNLVQELEAIVLTFIKSIRTRNWKMYVKSLKILCPWFFALNHHLYARWASVHIRDIETLEESGSDLIEEFAQGNFVVTKSRNRFSAIALDQNHEQWNATLKGKGGTIELFQKDEAFGRWLVTQPKPFELTRDFHEEFGMSNDKLSWLPYIMKKEKASKTDFAKNSTAWCRHLKTEATLLKKIPSNL